VSDELLDINEINLFVKREDLNHPYLSGNKWHKLKYNLAEAIEQKQNTILTFGGAYSNHIYALAYAGKLLNLKTIGIIRGEKHRPLNPTLNFAKENGMELHYINRSTYRNKNSQELLSLLKIKFGNFYFIPEGGSNSLAVKGCIEIINKINIDFDYLCCSCGTGGTFSGLVAGLNGRKNAIAFSALKGAEFLRKDISVYFEKINNGNYLNWELNLDYHFGGYAKFNSELIDFIKRVSEENTLPLEPIYTGKMLFGIFDLVKKKKFKKGNTIIALHTGGMQGMAGFKSRFGLELKDFNKFKPEIVYDAK
jgi:1-aminocyclopropane-1-carboxylate deaminase